MMEPIDFSSAKTIVEYGPGTGVFTRHILNLRNPETDVVLIEQNRKFYADLKNRYQGVKNLYIINSSAEYADEIVLKQLNILNSDAVVSGLPFTSLPKDVSLRILDSTKKLIGQDGCFITFQYTRVKENLFRQHFHIADLLFEAKNLPPAFVYVLKNYS